MTSAGNRKPAKAELDGDSREREGNFTGPSCPEPIDDRSTQQHPRESNGPYKITDPDYPDFSLRYVGRGSLQKIEQ